MEDTEFGRMLCGTIRYQLNIFPQNKSLRTFSFILPEIKIKQGKSSKTNKPSEKVCS